MFGGRRLLLAGTQLGWFWLGAGAIALALVLVLYRDERRLVSRRAGLGLLGLRLAAGLVLVGSLFEPIAARSYHETVKGRVLLAVDVSESMATVDSARPAEEQTRLAKELGLTPNESPASLSRRDVARRLLDGPLARIANDHGIEGIAFAREVASSTLGALVDALKRPVPAGGPSTLATDWQPALAEALKETDVPVLGVVLVTDGRSNAQGDATSTADLLAARRIPVYPVLVGSTTPPRDAAIASIKAPETVYKGDVASIEATLKLDGYAGRDVEVTLERPGAAPLRSNVHAPEDGSRPAVSFRVPMEQAGLVPFRIALPALEGDARPDNDQRPFSVQVADDKAKVLIVDGEARWEFRYLRNALVRDPHVEVDAVVFHQPETMGVASDANSNYPSRLPARPDAPTSQPDPIGAFDVVVAGDVGAADLTPEAWARLESYVGDRGGTLIVVPGPRHWETLVANPTARKLLPVQEPSPESAERSGPDPDHPSLPPGVPLVLTTAGGDATAWPMLQFASEPGQNRAVWSGLPRLPWLVSGAAKPGATILASGPDASRAAIAAHSYGLGKVLWVGTNATWRWRYRVGDAYHHRFWGQAIRWAASGKLAAGNSLVRFGPTRPKVGEGDFATIQARIADGVPGLGSGVLVAARIFRADPKTNQPSGESAAIVPLRPLPGQPRSFEGASPSLPVGSYVVRLDVPQLAEALKLDQPPIPQAPLEVAARDTSERIELAAARDPLDRLASVTGGRVFADYEAKGLPPLLHALNKQVARREETPLWDHPATLVLFFGILTTEWILRKRAGLP
ncbi:hypothetical protein [Singulisphaera sp. PoT]|uniref:hypothetical protein n=1 Tax=Singulisphaera sp. PoT TaxID=3411797 RepID=UPI003BF588D4